MTFFKKLIPILRWLPAYNRDHLMGDLSAGLTVGVMLIPQGMAYAMIAGLPPIYGLYASILPLILYAIFGTSRQLSVGPVAMVSLLVAAGVSTLAEGGTQEYIEMAILLALIVGVLQFLMGVFRLGFLVNFLSQPIISGFTSAAALIIGFNQLKHLFGIHLPRSNHVHEIFIAAIQEISHIHPTTLIIGLVGIGILVGIKKINRAIPGPLIVVVLSILAVWGLGLEELEIKIVGEVPGGLPDFRMPNLEWEALLSLFPIGLTIALVGYMQSIAVAKAIQAKHKNYKIEPNQELIGLGIANIGGSFLQAFPTTGGFARTAVSDQMGAKTGMASIISAFLIGITLLFLTPLFYYLPNAVLASVILVAVYGLIEVKEAFTLWKTDRKDFYMLLITFLATLLLGIEEGILIGVALSVAWVVYHTTQPHVAILGRVPGTSQYRNILRFPQAEVQSEVLIFRFDARLYFANINSFLESLEKAIEEKEGNLKVLVIEAAGINHIDSSGLQALDDCLELCRTMGISLRISGIKGPVRDQMSKSGFIKKVGAENFFLRVHDALTPDQLSHIETLPPENSYAIQSNSE